MECCGRAVEGEEVFEEAVREFLDVAEIIDGTGKVILIFFFGIVALLLQDLEIAELGCKRCSKIVGEGSNQGIIGTNGFSFTLHLFLQRNAHLFEVTSDRSNLIISISGDLMV